MSGCNKFLWGPVRRARCRCENACEGVFSTDPQFREGCKAVCSSNPDFFPKSGEDYLCQYASPEEVALARGYVPCGDTQALLNIEATGEALDANSKRQARTLWIAAGIAVVIFLFLNR